MWSFETVGTGQPPPWWRTVPYVLVTGFWSLLSVALSPPAWQLQHEGNGSAVLLAMLAMVVSVTLPLSLAWRGRMPFAITLGAAAASLLLPLGNALSLVALAALIGRRRGPAVWWTAGAVALSNAWVSVSDSLAQPRGASFWKTWLGPRPSGPYQEFDLSPLEVVVVVLVGLGIAVGLGLLVRSRREASAASAAVKEEQQTSFRLSDEVARRQERERIAREVHDSLGHRLSLLNLHAGALETNATDPRVARSAQLVRTSAADAMDDLRALLDLLQQPGEAELPPLALSELAQVVRDSYGAGQFVSSSIFVQDADRADPALTRAVYRIVQELLTNARKHAPEEKVLLAVEGRPGAGVTIEARNRYVPLPSRGGTHRGLTGISERAGLLGGTMCSGIDGDDFRVRVELPWRSA